MEALRRLLARSSCRAEYLVEMLELARRELRRERPSMDRLSSLLERIEQAEAALTLPLFICIALT